MIIFWLNYSSKHSTALYSTIKHNVKRDDEYTEYFVYVRRFNNIIKKNIEVGSGECVLEGTLDIKSFIEYIEQKYEKECSNYFLTKLLKYTNLGTRPKKGWLLQTTNGLIGQNLFDIAKEYFNEDMESLSSLKKDMALLYLRRLNKKEIDYVWIF